MGFGVSFITLSVLLFGQVFGDLNNDFDNDFNNDFNNDFDDNYFENGFNNDGLFIDSNDNFDDLNDLNDNFFENGFDDNGIFDSDDSNIVRGGILGGSRAVSRPAGRSASLGHLDYIPRHRQPRLQGRISAGALGGGLNQFSTRPMVLPRRMPKVLPMRMPKIMPKMMPRKMPKIMPRIGSGIGGFGGKGIGSRIGGSGRFLQYPNFGKYGGGMGRGRIPSFRRRRISAGIGGIQSRGFGKYYRHKMMGRGGLVGFPRKKMIKMY